MPGCEITENGDVERKMRKVSNTVSNKASNTARTTITMSPVNMRATARLQRICKLHPQLAHLPARFIALDARRRHVAVGRLEALAQVLTVRPRLVELLLVQCNRNVTVT